MKKIILLILLFYSVQSIFAQCTCNYSYTGNLVDTVTFSNLSTVSNAHYYWEFGDGSGSNDLNPVHIYFSSGLYIVTLYALDTITNCSDYYQDWISVTKPDTSTCNVYFEDTIIGNTFPMTNLSTNCFGYNLNCKIAGPGFNFCNSGLGNWYSGLYLHSMDAYTQDSVRGYVAVDNYVRSIPYLFDPNKNYQACSANFEVIINYQATGALVTFTAMNKHATGYQFAVVGFGNPILISNSTASQFYQYYGNYFGWLVELRTFDTINNCSDSVVKEILINNPFYRNPCDCSTSIYPQNQITQIGTNIQFIISTSPYANKQWQQNAGLGFMDLFNAGPFSGVYTDTLTINNVQLTMNNYHYRCIITGDTSGCHNTIPEVVLYVNPVGIEDPETKIVRIYPTLINDYLTIELLEDLTQAALTVYDILGKKVLESRLTDRNSKILTSDLSSGSYIVKINIGSKQIVRYIIKN